MGPDLHRLINQLPGMVFACKPEEGWPLTWVSEGCLSLCGYSTAELLAGDGLQYDRITFYEDRSAVLATTQEAARERREYFVEYRILTKSGDLKWVWEKGHGVYGGDGELVSLEGFVTDITSLKLSELSLKESAQRLHSIFENSAEGIFQSSANGTYQKVNPALARIYGFSSPEAMMTEFTDIGQQLYVDPQRRRQFVALLERRDRVSHFESEVWRRDGTKIWISENARAVRDEQGALLYYEGSVEDITGRKTAQEALANERNMLRTVIDAWPDIIYVKDTQGRYALSNRAHTRNLGLTEPREVEGRRPEDFFVSSRAARLSREDFELMEADRAVINREEVRIADGNKQRWYLCAKLPLHDSSGMVTGIVSLSRDITEHKRTSEQLRQSQKMEAIGRLAGGVAHDFNNIMTAILGFSELIAQKAAADPEITDDIGRIHAGAVRATALTQQLLAFSRKQVTLPKALNLNEVILGLEPMLRRLIGEHIRFETQLEPGISLVHADLSQVEQVIVNLVINARDAVNDSGTISLETSEVHLDRVCATQRLEVVPGRYVTLRVKDDGCGIPATVQDRIFEPFFTTKDQGKGTGLGLATCHGIVEQSGGHICLESEPGRGSIFSVFLPVQPEVVSVRSSNKQETQPATGSEAILVAEDDPAVRDFIFTILSDLGYRVFTAQHGEEAVAMLESGSIPVPELLLTDVVMPRMGGKALADHVRAKYPEMAVLFVSGYNEEEVLRRGIVAETIAFVSKPFSIETLARKVRQLLDQPVAKHGA
jgi:two-component system cell cycle sensor histidine kinase/response regulator CckA